MTLAGMKSLRGLLGTIEEVYYQSEILIILTILLIRLILKSKRYLAKLVNPCSILSASCSQHRQFLDIPSIPSPSIFWLINTVRLLWSLRKSITPLVNHEFIFCVRARKNLQAMWLLIIRNNCMSRHLLKQ